MFGLSSKGRTDFSQEGLIGFDKSDSSDLTIRCNLCFPIMYTVVFIVHDKKTLQTGFIELAVNPEQTTM